MFWSIVKRDFNWMPFLCIVLAHQTFLSFQQQSAQLG